MRLIRLAVVVAIGIFCSQQLALAESSSAYNGTARWWTKPDGHEYNEWAFSDPTASDTVTYVAGPDITDSVVNPTNTVGPVTKFADPLGDKSFYPWGQVGGLVVGPGPKGSLANNDAKGSGFSKAGFVYGTNWLFCLHAYASGTLGNGAGANWDSKTAVNDPSYMGPSAFSGITDGNTADVYIPVALLGETGLAQSDPSGPDSTQIGQSGSVSLHVDIATATTTYDLLDISVSGATGMATMTPSPLGSSVSYYLQDELTDGPPTNSASSIADIQSAIDADLSDGQLLSDINIGIVFSGMPVPTQSIDAGGDLAAIDIDASAEDSAAAVPEPASLALMLPVCLLLYRRATAPARRQPALC
jgi:hypothetical protein